MTLVEFLRARYMEAPTRKEQIMNDEIEVLRRRVKELEDTVLYLSNTLALHGIFSPAEASTAQRMHENAARIGWGQP